MVLIELMPRAANTFLCIRISELSQDSSSFFFFSMFFLNYFFFLVPVAAALVDPSLHQPTSTDPGGSFAAAPQFGQE